MVNNAEVRARESKQAVSVGQDVDRAQLLAAGALEALSDLCNLSSWPCCLHAVQLLHVLPIRWVEHASQLLREAEIGLGQQPSSRRGSLNLISLTKIAKINTSLGSTSSESDPTGFPPARANGSFRSWSGKGAGRKRQFKNHGLKSIRPPVNRTTMMLHASANGSLRERQATDLIARIGGIVRPELKRVSRQV